MIISEAIILAGGLGTRLRSAVPDLPKCMAPVNGEPFIRYVIEHLQSQGIDKFIFCLGYKHEVIEEYLKTAFHSLRYKISLEEAPLGTGGAIKLACKRSRERSVLVANGDTLFKIDLTKVAGFHALSGSNCTLSLKPMQNFDRYGVVEINGSQVITSFKEKQFYSSGLINGGVYALHVHKFLDESLPDKFSFEKDYLEVYYKKRRMFGIEQDEYFIDIGIPEDYERAQAELKNTMNILADIDESWTLFLDRDGVINHEKKEDYILHWGEFKFYPGVKEALNILSDIFGTIVMVTNQRGIGKGLMTADDLTGIHDNMLTEIRLASGRIDKIYYCPELDNACYERKPNPGMAHQALKDFPHINLSKSIIIGNKLSDMQFGRNAGMYTLYVATTNPEVPFPHPLIDFRFNDLAEAAHCIQSSLRKS